MPIRVTIWNAQGGGISDLAKKQQLEDVAKKYNSSNIDHYFLIQEGGVAREGEPFFETTLGGKKYIYFQEEAQDADNNRCTTAIMVPADVWKHIKCPDAYVMDVGFSRPFLGIFLEDFKLFTFHAPAFNPKYARKCEHAAMEILAKDTIPWIIGGDMNCQPSEFETCADGRTLNNGCGGVIWAPDEVTHPSSEPQAAKILDFYIASTAVCAEDITVIPTGGLSDHEIVTALFGPR